MDEAEIGCLIERIYDMALEPDLWPDLISGLASAFGGNAGGLEQEHAESERGAAVVVGLDPSVISQYFEYYAARNVLRRIDNFGNLIKKYTPIITVDQDTLPKHDLMKTEFYADFLRPVGIHSTLAVGLWGQGDSVTVLGVYRPANRPSFGEPERALAERLHPHLIRAFRLSRTFAESSALRADLAVALDQSAHGILVLGGGHVRHANAAALRLLAEPGGVSVLGGVLVASSPDDTERLRAMICRAQQGRIGGAVSVRRPGGKAPLAVVASPLAAHRLATFHAEPGVMVCVTDPDAAAVPETYLRDGFGLTGAEARLARMLVQGQSLQGAAAELDVTYSTVRSQLQRIFEKTGASRQAELVALLTRRQSIGPL